MNPQETQDITPEEAKAALGLSNRLSEQYLAMQAPQAPEMQENALGEEEMDTMGEEEGFDMQAHMKEMESKMDEKIESLRAEVKSIVAEEVSGLRKDIKEALDNEQD